MHRPSEAPPASDGEGYAGAVAALRVISLALPFVFLNLHARYLLLWLTELPLAPDGVDYQGGVAEVEVFRS